MGQARGGLSNEVAKNDHRPWNGGIALKFVHR
jgi:hypothetical protein